MRSFEILSKFRFGARNKYIGLNDHIGRQLNIEAELYEFSQTGSFDMGRYKRKSDQPHPGAPSRRGLV